ncbi:MAG: hypothetical protein ABEL76_13860, partial [Bradymonadaceae bacterium]
DELADLLDVVRREEVLRADWQICGRTSRRLREQGLTVALLDVLVATVADRCGYPVLTTDRDVHDLPPERYPIDRH